MYPQSEVIRFLNRFIKKRNKDGTINPLIQREDHQALNGLDFGCGVGTHCLIFNDFDIEGYGVDISSTAVKIARKRAKKRGIKDSRFIVLDADSQKLPFRDDFFDFIVAESCLDSMPFSTAQSYMHELKRITNGLIYASFIGSNDSTVSEEFVVSTDHEKGTIQSVYDKEKIQKLFGMETKKFKYFKKIVQIDSMSDLMIDCRYYCVV